LAEQPVIFLFSSSDNEKILQESKSLGVKVAMVKPVKFSQLMDALSKVFGKQSSESLKINQGNLKGKMEKLSGNYKIMVAEDNKTNMILAKAILKRILPESEIIMATNGREAVDLYKETFPDMIFMDIQMPELNGYHATREIRLLENGTGRSVPIIALTAGTVKGEEIRCIDAGMNDYTSKPVIEETIRRLLHTWLLKNSINELDDIMIQENLKLYHFNRAELLSRLNGDDYLLKELLRTAGETYEDLIRKINDAFADGECTEAKLIAHSIKGSAISICCHKLAEIAGRLELLPETEKAKGPGLIQELNEEYWLLKKEFAVL
jgi:CheY-like chemotaxis protein/HPt (histidine-containing phosphotransfer) domain-containing protein